MSNNEESSNIRTLMRRFWWIAVIIVVLLISLCGFTQAEQILKLFRPPDATPTEASNEVVTVPARTEAVTEAPTDKPTQPPTDTPTPTKRPRPTVVVTKAPTEPPTEVPTAITVCQKHCEGTTLITEDCVPHEFNPECGVGGTTGGMPACSRTHCGNGLCEPWCGEDKVTCPRAAGGDC